MSNPPRQPTRARTGAGGGAQGGGLARGGGPHELAARVECAPHPLPKTLPNPHDPHAHPIHSPYHSPYTHPTLTLHTHPIHSPYTHPALTLYTHPTLTLHSPSAEGARARVACDQHSAERVHTLHCRVLTGSAAGRLPCARACTHSTAVCADGLPPGGRLCSAALLLRRDARVHRARDGQQAADGHAPRERPLARVPTRRVGRGASADDPHVSREPESCGACL
eukprot:4067766-Prymnesium_polylepis.1